MNGVYVLCKGDGSLNALDVKGWDGQGVVGGVAISCFFWIDV